MGNGDKDSTEYYRQTIWYCDMQAVKVSSVASAVQFTAWALLAYSYMYVQAIYHFKPWHKSMFQMFLECIFLQAIRKLSQNEYCLLALKRPNFTSFNWSHRNQQIFNQLMKSTWLCLRREQVSHIAHAQSEFLPVLRSFPWTPSRLSGWIFSRISSVTRILTAT